MLPHAGYFSALAQGAAAQTFPALVCHLDLSYSPVAMTTEVGYTRLNILQH